MSPLALIQNEHAMSYPDTYYKRTMAEGRSRPALSGREECDTVIIGGGLAGLTTALQLVRGGQRVVLLEAESVGFGASGRNGGFVSPGFATGSDEIARMAGDATAKKLFHLSAEGVEFIRDNIRDLKIEGADVQLGIISVLRHDDGASLRDYREHLLKDYGYELDYLETDEVRSVLKSERYFQGLRNPHAFHMHPLNYLRGLAAEIERLGGKIYEGSAAIETSLSGAEKRIRTSGGEVRARQVVFTTGGYTGDLEPRLKRSFLPIATSVRSVSALASPV